MCLSTEPSSLDPVLCTKAADATLVGHLFSGLARWDVVDGEAVVVPDVAIELVEPEEGDDGTLTYTYELREGCAWSDGRPLEARDFAFAWGRLADVGQGAEPSRLLSCLAAPGMPWLVRGQVGDGDSTATDADPEVELETGEEPGQGADAGATAASAEAEVADESPEVPAAPDGDAPGGGEGPDPAHGVTEGDPAPYDEATDADGAGPEGESAPEEVPEAGDEAAEAPAPVLAVEAVDARTLRVTLAHHVPRWEELLASPWLKPVREDVVLDPRWADDPSTLVSNGPYLMGGWEHGSVLTMERNPEHHEADLARPGTIGFYLSESVENRVANFQNGTWSLVDVTSYDALSVLAEESPSELRVDQVAGTYLACWDVNEEVLPQGHGLGPVEAELARAEVRRAVALLFDRDYVVGQLAQGGQLPAASFVPWRMPDAGGGEFWQAAGADEDHVGYYDVSPEALAANFEAAVEALRRHYPYDEAAGTFSDVPAVIIQCTTEGDLGPTNEYLRSSMSQVGIDASVVARPDGVLLAPQRRDGVSLACLELHAPCTDPLCMLGAWASGSPDNVAGLGQGAHAEVAAYGIDLSDLGLDVVVEGGTWAQTYDVLLDLARSQGDGPVRSALLHRAEDLLMQTGAVCPLFFCTSSRLVAPGLTGVAVNPLGSVDLRGCVTAG